MKSQKLFLNPGKEEVDQEPLATQLMLQMLKEQLCHANTQYLVDVVEAEGC